MEQQAAQIQLQMEALASQVQALTTAQQTQQQVNAQLQLEKEQLEQRLNVALGQLQLSLQNGGAAGAVPQPSAGSSAGTSKPVSHSVLEGQGAVGTLHLSGGNLSGTDQ